MPARIAPHVPNRPSPPGVRLRELRSRPGAIAGLIGTLALAFALVGWIVLLCKHRQSGEPPNMLSFDDGWLAELRRLAFPNEDADPQLCPTKNREPMATIFFDWLAAQQHNDGSWQLHRAGDDDNGSEIAIDRPDANQVAGTSLALLCYLAIGQTHCQAGPYRYQISAALKSLMAHQATDGSLGRCENGRVDLLAHAWATNALCGSYALSDDASVGAAAQRAVDFLQQSQDVESGGWIDQHGRLCDLPTLAWIVDAAVDARSATFAIEPNTFQGARRYLDSFAWRVDERDVLLDRQSDDPSSLTMIASGMHVAEQLGISRNAPSVVAGVKLLVSNLPVSGQTGAIYLYRGSLVIHNQLGPDWDVWSRTTRRQISRPPLARGDAQSCGREKSCPAVVAANDPGGRFFSSCLTMLMIADSNRKFWYILSQPQDNDFACESFAWEYERRPK